MNKFLTAFLAFTLMCAPLSSWATGGHVVVPVKVVPVVTPVPAPPPPTVAVPPPSPAAAPQPQPSGGGSGPGLMGWIVMAGVAIYFALVIWEREKWCLNNHCYKPLRDGMPK